MTTKFLAISIALASILPTHAIADDKTGPSHPLGGGMNPNDGVCTSHDWGAEVIICTGSKGNWSCLPRGDGWACYADDVVWSTDCPSCSRPSDDEVGRIQDEPKATGDCRWGDPAGTDYDCVLQCGDKWIAACTYFSSFDATICAHANGSVTLDGEICPPY